MAKLGDRAGISARRVRAGFLPRRPQVDRMSSSPGVLPVGPLLRLLVPRGTHLNARGLSSIHLRLLIGSRERPALQRPAIPRPSQLPAAPPAQAAPPATLLLKESHGVSFATMHWCRLSHPLLSRRTVSTVAGQLNRKGLQVDVTMRCHSIPRNFQESCRHCHKIGRIRSNLAKSHTDGRPPPNLGEIVRICPKAVKRSSLKRPGGSDTRLTQGARVMRAIAV